MSRPEHPTHTTGAPRSHGAARRRPDHAARDDHHSSPDHHTRHGTPQRPYEPHLDGLFTYCLSVLCAHDAAAAVLGETLALAERQQGRQPVPQLYRPWLYALARWACLRRLAEPIAPDAEADPEAGRRELAVLAWPEAAGTTPEQRETLELSVRHRLPAGEVAAVLGTEPAATHALLAAASCEVERTRAALAVVESGRCPDVARLAGDTQVLLGAALRRELVRHVDECAECRRTAERATAAGPWPGTAPAAQGDLPLVGAPREAVLAALAAARRTKSGRAEGVAGAGSASGVGRAGRSGWPNGSPRYDRAGFPVRPTDRAARRRRLRSRVMTTTVVATVLAAPVLALWAAYRGAPEAGEPDASHAVTSSDADASRLDGRPYENAGNASTTPQPGFPVGGHTPDVSVEVTGGPRLRPGSPGRLTVAAQPSGGTTVVTLSASGGVPVRWTAAAAAPWVHISRTAGELEPGRTAAVTVYVDRDREPVGHWRTRVVLDPGGAALTIEGHGTKAPGGGPAPTGPAPADPAPTPPPTGPAPADPGTVGPSTLPATEGAAR
ncbi:BACON domain-containing protein [Streptomyces pinistramenti]|uniref:BACON domain-containing protein n=1 Tax=Streptomyces pinistramenti TaxID=2884812 RepID=UPI001D0827EE|nr:sigma-70 family RNA polymerase sigma factor [Streptomyces pinistramenti]MCB5911451.1 sigma-70 family RNA polymerase sigma factor [Streptomyces pinistramenti]